MIGQTERGQTVTIRPAVADIMVVRVDGKQMTKALYNQLQEVPLEALDSFMQIPGEEPGTIWGWVNDCPKDCRYPFSVPTSYFQIKAGQPYARCAHRHVIGTRERTGMLVRSTVFFVVSDKTDEGTIDTGELDGAILIELPQLYIAI